jgi:hypothetical protein
MSTFRITPEDVGRKARAKNGLAYMVYKGRSDSYPYMTGKGACTSEGKLYYSDGTCGDDLVSWADEPVTDQPRPKDLRDEFAMVAFSAHFSTDSLVKALRDMSERDNMNPTEILSKVCYEYADAMLKAREGI